MRGEGGQTLTVQKSSAIESRVDLRYPGLANSMGSRFGYSLTVASSPGTNGDCLLNYALYKERLN